MADRAPAWVVPVMRAGFSSRGIVYTITGVLVVLAAWTGGNAEGTKGALEILRGATWGTAILWVIAAGLVCYAIWRFLDSWMDLEREGSDAKGIVARLGQIVTGIIHLGLAAYAGHLAMGGPGSGGGQGGSGGGTERWSAWLLQQDPWGRWVLIAIGAIVVGAGIYYAYKGVSGKYREHLRATPTMEKLTPACVGGLVAHGLVVGLVGVFIVWAGWTSDASEAGGLGKAFEAIRGATYGQILLGIVGVGLVGFAIYCFIEAIYRVVPARAGDDVSTLASKAKAKAEGAAHRAEGSARRAARSAT